MKCSKCGFENKQGDQSCKKCGQPLSKPALTEESYFSYEWRPLAFVVFVVIIIVAIKNVFFK